MIFNVGCICFLEGIDCIVHAHLDGTYLWNNDNPYCCMKKSMKSSSKRSVYSGQSVSVMVTLMCFCPCFNSLRYFFS